MRHFLLSIALPALLLTVSSGVRAQNTGTYERGATQLENCLPPSPEAAAAVKYADVPFTHSLGMAELSVPLYTLQGRELTLPLSLEYRSGGIKLDEVAGVAGLGWTLQGGGCITRTVVDMPDDGSFLGDFTHQMPSETLLPDLLSQTNSTDAMNYLRKAAWHQLENSLDRFSYSVCGLSGTFLILDNQSVFHLSGNGCEITYTRDNDGAIDSFTLVGPDGTVYSFEDIETSTHRGRYTPPTPIGGPEDDWEATTAWYLSSITSASGLETATFDYTSGGTWICDICPKVRTAVFVCDGVSTSGSYDIDSDVIQHRYETLLLSSVSLSGFTASFSYASQTGYSRHVTAATWDRYANYPAALTGMDVSYGNTLLQHVDIGTEQDTDDGRIVLKSLRYFRGGILDDRWDFSYAHPAPPGYFGGTVSRYSQDWYGYYNAENEIIALGDDPSSSRTSVCPYKMENEVGSPVVSLCYGTPDGDYAHYMSLESADHDGARTAWNYEGASISVGSSEYSVGCRVASIAVKDNGADTVRLRSFTYGDAVARGRLYPTVALYMNTQVKQGLTGGGLQQGVKYTWSISLHETPVTDGPSIQDAKVIYREVTEEVTGGASQHGARTCYTYDTSYAIPAETSTIARFPSGWAAVYNSSYAPAVISPWWGIRDGYADSGPEAPALLTGKDVYKWDGTQYVLTERDIYGYGTLSRRQALVDYRASQIMKRILPGNIQYEDIYHYPVWANDYAGVTPSSVRHITCHSEGNDTTLVSYSYASRSSLSVPIRVSRKTVETGGVKRCVDYTYPDTWGVGRPTWAAQLTARHSLAGSVKENYGRLVPREFPIHHLHDSTRDSSSENTRIIQPVTFEPWLEVVTEHAPFMVNGVSRWLPSRLTESVDGVLSWSEEVLARDCMGNPTSMKEKGKPLTSVVWGYNGLFPVVIAQNASLADVITGLGGQTAADAITTASLVSSLQLSALDALRTSLQQAHVHTYAYAPGLGLLNQTDPAGIKTSYDRDGAGRLTAQRDADGNAIKAYIYSLLNSNGHRSIKSRTYQTADGGTFAEDIRWWNTLGLLQEDIAMGTSGSGGADLVTAYEGDYLLHDDVKTWLPYPASGTSGAFQSNAPAAAANYHNSSLAFSYKGYEDSVRNRVERSALPGYAGAHEAQSQLAVNMAWPKLDWDDTQGIVTDGVVSVLEERETDADGRRVSTFRDGEGRVLGSSRGAATPTSTDSAPVYYVYDKHDRLRAVAGSGIALTDTLNMWRYGYDALSRLSSKGVPGLMRETYTYDSEDRLTTIIRSDGLRQMDYDAFGRVLTVTFTPTGETTPVLMESHSYDSEPASSVSIMIACGEPSSWAGAKNGLETYRQVAQLNEDGTVTGYAATAIRYDEKGRVVCTATAWPDGTYTKEKNTYSFPGKVTASVVTCIRSTESDTLSTSNTYDIRGRLIKTVSTLTGDAVATPLSDTTRFQYDALGRLQKCISKAGGTSISHTSSINYNLQGLQNRQSLLIGSDSLYVERLAYDNPSAITGLSGINPSYSGYLTGITEVWPGITSQSEGYSYSTSGRLTCVHHPGNSEQYSYDGRGNLLTAPSQTYSYSGDRLTSLTDSALQTFSFQYDNLGRMTSDGQAGVTITYNALDLPGKISNANAGVLANYSYLADGTKAEALAADGTGLVYRGSLIYRKTGGGSLSLESAITPAGRITPAGVRHHVTDHLGSVVAVVDAVTGSLYEAGEYGVYGSRSSVSGISLATLPAGETLRDHFTGKEDQGPDYGLPYTDFGARHYSPALRRWLTPDPLAEKYYDVSPYAYCDGNPVMMVDEDGRDWYSAGIGESIKYYYDDNVASQMDMNNMGIEGEYIGRTAFNANHSLYYSMFGEVVRYRDQNGCLTFEGQMYRKIDKLLLATEDQIINEDSYGGEPKTAPRVDFFLGLSNPIYKPFEFNGYFEGTHFVSARGGTLYQGMKKEASSLTITSMPNKFRQIRGWIGAPRWEGYFITIGIGNNDKIQVQYDRNNGPLFKAAWAKHIRIHQQK